MNHFKTICFLAQFPFWGGLNDMMQARRYRQWIKRGKPMPPPHKVKQQVLQNLGKTYSLTTLVETGTLVGDMIYAMRNNFSFIYSIEVYRPLFERAVKRFRRLEKVAILNGDSGVVLAELVNRLNQPTLFWLDGHYSGEGTGKGEGDTPIYKELEAIFGLKIRFVVAIDDARLFGTDPAYPDLGDLTDFVHSRGDNLKLFVENDIIQITQNETSA